jgi:hypothetical protein
MDTRLMVADVAGGKGAPSDASALPFRAEVGMRSSREQLTVLACNDHQNTSQ